MKTNQSTWDVIVQTLHNGKTIHSRYGDANYSNSRKNSQFYKKRRLCCFVLLLFRMRFVLRIIMNRETLCFFSIQPASAIPFIRRRKTSIRRPISWSYSCGSSAICRRTWSESVLSWVIICLEFSQAAPNDMNALLLCSVASSTNFVMLSCPSRISRIADWTLRQRWQAISSGWEWLGETINSDCKSTDVRCFLWLGISWMAMETTLLSAWIEVGELTVFGNLRRSRWADKIRMVRLYLAHACGKWRLRCGALPERPLVASFWSTWSHLSLQA